MKRLFAHQLIKGEMFEAFVIKDDKVVFEYRPTCIDFCFGNFTQNKSIQYEILSKVKVRLFFKHDPNLLLKNEQCKLLNYTVFETESSCKKEFSYIYQHTSSYVDFKYTVHMNECNKSFEDRYGGEYYRTNSYISFEFKNCYMYEIFLVLHMYRRFLQLSSKREYWLSKELTQKKWHNLSFINNAMFCDAFSKIMPLDQKILLHGIFPSMLPIRFISKTAFRNNKKYFERSTYSLSAMCVADLEHYLKYKNFTTSFLSMSYTQYFRKLLFKHKNLVKRDDADYKVLEKAYNDIINKYFKTIKRLLKCTK